MIPKTSRYSNPVYEYSPVYTYWMAYLMTLSDWVMSCQAWPPHARCGEWARCKHWRLAVYFFYKIACFNGVYLTHCHTNSTGISIWHKNRYTSSSKLGGSLLFVIFNYQTLWPLGPSILWPYGSWMELPGWLLPKSPWKQDITWWETATPFYHSILCDKNCHSLMTSMWPQL